MNLMGLPVDRESGHIGPVSQTGWPPNLVTGVLMGVLEGVNVSNGTSGTLLVLETPLDGCGSARARVKCYGRTPRGGVGGLSGLR